jgi:tetratricopeptide (TPR) repeat protein
MADRYLLVPTVGAVLALLALAAALMPEVRPKQIGLCAALLAVVTAYTFWSYDRTKVWCGKTTLWHGHQQPDLSLWASAVETNPEDTTALTFLALALLRLNPPEADQALAHLNRALELSEANQAKIAGDRQLILSPLYETLGDAYLTQASQFPAGTQGSEAWRQKKDAYFDAAKYLRMASQALSGFARLFSRLAEACEGQAQMDALELTSTTPDRDDSLIAERDKLRAESEESMRRAEDILIGGRVSSGDPNYRMVIIARGNIFFGREMGATNDEKAGYYRRALSLYEDAAAMFPDDPRPFLDEGLCYERLTGLSQSQDEKRRQFALGEAALRKALALNVVSPDYTPALPYRALASLYAHMNDYHSVLDSLKNAQQADPASAELEHLDREIQSVEQYLAGQGARR